MNLFIPTIGTKLRLTQDWSLRVQNERRNKNLIEGAMDVPYDKRYGKGIKYDLTLPEGTVLTVDRIYIRQKAGDYDSVTFLIDSCPDENYESNRHLFGKRGYRFWAELEDVNTIECDVVDE